jgi:hypothetical protein
MTSLQTTLISSQLLGMADIGIKMPDPAIQVEHYLQIMTQGAEDAEEGSTTKLKESETV